MAACDCCAHALHWPQVTKRQYSMGCNWCAARYLRDGGEADIAKWEMYGVDVNEVNELRRQGEFIDPEIRKRK